MHRDKVRGATLLLAFKNIPELSRVTPARNLGMSRRKDTGRYGVPNKCGSYFSNYCDRIHDKSYLRKDVFIRAHCLRMLLILVAEALWWEPEVAASIASAHRCSPRSFFCIQSGVTARAAVEPTFSVDFPTSVNSV